MAREVKRGQGMDEGIAIVVFVAIYQSMLEKHGERTKEREWPK